MSEQSAARGVGMKLLSSLQTCCYVMGLCCVAYFSLHLVRGETSRAAAIEQFSAVPRPDTSLWAPGRIADYEASLEVELPPVMGVLRIPSLDLEVPVFPSASDLVMNRGAGVIDGMAYPHEPGNIGIAGHRDGYFRVLKDIQVGDRLTLQTLLGPRQFTVNKLQIVEMDDTRLLQDTEEQTLTLVTCYPFYFVGHAPQRFIVTASLDTTNVILN